MPDDQGTTTAAPAHPLARRSAGWSLLGSEIAIMYRRRRTWAMLSALAAIPVLIAVAVRLTSAPPSGRGPAFLSNVTENGIFVALTALVVSTPLFLPLTVSVIAGDSISGEAGHGTLRYLLVAPAGRARLLGVKFAAAVVFALTAAVTVVVAGVLIGAALFPTGDVVLLSGTTVSFGEGLLRLLAVAGYVAVSFLGLSAIGLFVSTLTDVPVGAMAATVVVSVVAQVLGALPQLEWLHPWLFTHHWLGFGDLLRDPISWTSFTDNAVLQLGYVLVFGALALIRFTTKDVLS